MRGLIAKSMLPSLTLDISDNDIPAAVERVADWMEQTGGLYTALGHKLRFFRRWKAQFVTVGIIQSPP